MDEQTAARLAAELKSMAGHFNELSKLSMSIADEVERRQFRAALGRLMASADCVLIRPIARQYPHLDL